MASKKPTGQGKSGKGFRFDSKASDKVRQLNQTKKKSKLDPIRDEFRSLVNRANDLISRLIHSKRGLSSSPTYIKIFGEDGANRGEKFNIDDKHRFREIRREINRVNEFLTAEDSTVSGSEMVGKVVDAIAEHKISFRDQNIDADGNRFSNLDQDRIKFAMKIYRQIADSEYLAIGRGKGQFGSDNLINMIYDELEGYDPNLSERQQNKLEKKVMQMGYDLLDRFKRDSLMGFLSGSPEPSEDVNIVEQLKQSKSAEEFFKKNDFLNPKRGR